MFESKKINQMKTFRNLAVFIGTYFGLSTVTWILVIDRLSWLSVARSEMMLFIGIIASIFITVCYAVEQQEA